MGVFLNFCPAHVDKERQETTLPASLIFLGVSLVSGHYLDIV